MFSFRDKLTFLRSKKVTLVSITILPLLLATAFFPFLQPKPARPQAPSLSIRATVTPKPSPSIKPSKTLHAASAVSTTPTKAQQSSVKVLFGMGSEADGAIQTRLVKESPTKMLSSWYNGPNDLSWMTGWKHNLIPDLYAKGYTLHLITFTDYPETNFSTKYGPACGREYPLSPRFLDDMKQLADTFNGSGPLYVTLFTEFQTYPCSDNTYVGSENYYKALQDQYLSARAIFKQYAPNAHVAISWGGWQSRWDDPANGGGKSLFPYFANILKDSDFTAFQAMESGTNVEDIRNMTKILGSYKKPVMVAHYKPDNGSQTTFDTDIKAILTESYLKEVTTNGLFAFSFMDTVNLNASEDTYQFVKNNINTFAKPRP